MPTADTEIPTLVSQAQTATDLARAAQELGLAYVAFGLFAVFALGMAAFVVWLVKSQNVRAKEDRDLSHSMLEKQGTAFTIGIVELRTSFASELKEQRGTFTDAINKIITDNEEFHDDVTTRITEVEVIVRNVHDILRKH